MIDGGVGLYVAALRRLYSTLRPRSAHSIEVTARI